METAAAATFCATLVDEWARAGITAAFVAPGSRSTPLTLAIDGDQRIALHLFHDERSAGFAALGHGLATGRPAVAVCTSGTAAAHFLAPVIEADLSSVPLIVCTADRPPELWDIGAPQTIDQTHLFGRAVRHFAEPGAPDPAAAGSWRSLAARARAEAVGIGGRPGPVHLNLSFRDPLVGRPGPLPPDRAGDGPWHEVDPAGPAAGSPGGRRVAGRLHHRGRARPGIVIAGAGAGPGQAVIELADRLGWPVLADHRSGARSGPGAVTHFDALARSPAFVAANDPEVVLRFGEPPASKALSQWLARTGAEVITVVDRSRWSDPERVASRIEATTAAAIAASLPADLVPSDAVGEWRAADRLATAAVAAVLAGGGPGPTEVGVACDVVAGMASGEALVVSSSMPVRDVEWFGPNRNDIEVFANRGANGIDGVVSTSVGVALTGRPTTALLGDVALLHDSSALTALRSRPVALRIVVIDNDGGGIFSFLPQAEQLAAARFERLFGTPHGTDLAALARAHGVEVEPWGRATVTGAVEKGVVMTIATTDRAANADLHHRLNRAVVAAVEDQR